MIAIMLRYSTDDALTVESFKDVLIRSTLGERRPVHDDSCLEGMIKNADITVTCWDGDLLVGVARSVTDFTFCCYLSDLAVDRAWQKKGIGRKLIDVTREKLGPLCKVILLSAPAAVNYYPHIGFTHHPQAWILSNEK